MSDAQQDANDVVLKVPVAEAVASFGAASVLVKEPLAIQHLWAARHFTDLAVAREKLLVSNDVRRPDLAHRSYVMSAVMSAATLMEAIVNDVFIDAADEALRVRARLLAPFEPVQNRRTGVDLDCY